MAGVTAGARDLLGRLRDAHQFREHAARFSLASFQSRMVATVDDVWRSTR